jgi:hypothetical protein
VSHEYNYLNCVTSTNDILGREIDGMSYQLKIAEKDVFGKGKFKNASGKTECTEFIRQATGAPATIGWCRGVKVADAKPGQILRGTAIATFDDNGKYPTDGLGKHAAIYLSHSQASIQVLDQWDDQGEVKPRPIWFNRPKGTRRSNDATAFFVIE